VRTYGRGIAGVRRRIGGCGDVLIGRRPYHSIGLGIPEEITTGDGDPDLAALLSCSNGCCGDG